MRIAIGADHAGFHLKESLLSVLRDSGHEVVDVGTDSDQAVDYPDFTEAVAVAVRGHEVDRGVMICGSGVGASVAANKVQGIRAAVCHDSYSAHQGVEHDDMNVLVLGARIVGASLATELVNAFLGATFSGDERHLRRMAKVARLEARDWSDTTGGAR
ncbi:MAG TPA: ribose 5-phosphate isomerase B [Acidobacteria bacterium]|jgi:ribose 5-phosphate isomerase B|nr:ribose 5-phosphate isomerase B [Acidobacteriota bacterium]